MATPIEGDFRSRVQGYYQGGTWKTLPNGERRFVPGGGSGSGGGGRAGGGRVGTAQNVNTAATDPRLEALLNRYNKQAGALEAGSGHVLDIAAQRARDAREGGRRALAEGATFRGSTGGGELAGYEAETTRGVQQAITDAALGRENLLNQFILGGSQIAGAPGEAARADRALGLQQQAVTAQIQANQAAANQSALLALLGAARSSPLQGTPALPTYF